MIAILFASLLTAAAPAPADQPITPPEDPLAPIAEPHETDAKPAAPPAAIVAVPKDWPALFAAIRGGQWAAAQAGLAALPRSPLTPLATAMLYTAKGSPAVSADQIAALLAAAPELPQAEQLQRMAATRGTTSPPPVPRRAALVPIGSTPRRGRTAAVTGDPLADSLRLALEPLVKADDAAAAEALLVPQLPYLTPEARAELGQRVAWIYYVRGEDGEARRLADLARSGTAGPWGVQAEWVSGLASWRQNDCEAAARAFREVGQRSTEASLAAAGYYWSARAEMKCRRPILVQSLLKSAARNPETFYGLLARRTLGMETALKPLDLRPAERVAALPNIVRARALVGMGERDLAGELLRHQARIGTPADQPGLVAEARKLELAATQHFLAHFGQPGARVPAAARYPAPSWRPREGWRIDPALALGHALQESSFRAEAVSPAGAVGLMQVLPSTRDLISRSRGLPTGNLRDIATNLSFGQGWIEWMRGHSATGGQLPKVIASYNAGPLPVGRWAINDRGDPLLWIESMPYWETRFYVPAVMRNMWIYQGFEGRETPTLTAMAQHRWPSFPTAR